MSNNKKFFANKKLKIRGDAGQSFIEYIILVALIAMVSTSATSLLGGKIRTKINEIREAIDRKVVIHVPDEK